MSSELITISFETLAFLVGIALLAGMVDSVAGGGGLITMPAFLWAGLSPAQALATNKLQASFGSFTATANFYHKGHFKLREFILPVMLTFMGAAFGAVTVQSINPEFLATIIPFLLIGMALYFLLQPSIGKEDQKHRIGIRLYGLIFGFSIGFYDGFFGPGTGSFFSLSLVTLLGFNLLKATAHAKLLNFTSNFASLLFFAFGGEVVWLVGFSMAAGQLVGAYIGSTMTMKHGQKLIRPIIVIVSIAMTIKLVASSPDHPIRNIFGF